MIMDYYRKYAEFDEHISEMNQTGLDLMSDSYKKFVKYYRSVRHLFEKKNIIEKHDWDYINDPSSPEFKELESIAVFYHYKQTVFENYYKVLKTEALSLIKEINSILKNK
jgi:hypothetical protein